MRLLHASAEELHALSDDEDGRGEIGDGDFTGATASPGRRSIEIAYIKEKQKRHISFSKRKAGIFKKAHELATLTGTQVLLLIVSETGVVYTYATPRLSPLVSARDGQRLIQSCLNGNVSESSSEEADVITPPSPINDPFGSAGSTLVDDYLPSKSPGRSVKRRKTIENLSRAVGSSKATPLSGQPSLSISSMMVSYEESVAQMASGAAFDATELACIFHALSTSMESSGTSPLTTNGSEHLAAATHNMLNDFLPAHDPAKIGLASTVLTAWAQWLFSSGWIDATLRTNILRHCGHGPAPAARRVLSNGRLRRRIESAPDPMPPPPPIPGFAHLASHDDCGVASYLDSPFDEAGSYLMQMEAPSTALYAHS